MDSCSLGDCAVRAGDGNHPNSLHHYAEILESLTFVRGQGQAQPMRRRASGKSAVEQIERRLGVIIQFQGSYHDALRRGNHQHLSSEDKSLVHCLKPEHSWHCRSYPLHHRKENR